MSAAYEQLAVDALEQIGATTARAQLDQVAQQGPPPRAGPTAFPRPPSSSSPR